MMFAWFSWAMSLTESSTMKGGGSKNFLLLGGLSFHSEHFECTSLGNVSFSPSL